MSTRESLLSDLQYVFRECKRAAGILFLAGFIVGLLL